MDGSGGEGGGEVNVSPEGLLVSRMKSVKGFGVQFRLDMTMV